MEAMEYSLFLSHSLILKYILFFLNICLALAQFWCTVVSFQMLFDSFHSLWTRLDRPATNQ